MAITESVRSDARSDDEARVLDLCETLLAELPRVLGLPGDIRTDKDRPWIEVPRS